MLKLPSRGRKIFVVIWLSCVLFAMFAGSLSRAHAQEFAAVEGELRAAVTVGVLRFTSWEDKTSGPPSDKLQVCLIGQPVSEPYLLPVDGVAHVGNRSLLVDSVKNETWDHCQAFVIGAKTQPDKFADLLAYAETHNVLTVCDGCGLTDIPQAMITLKVVQQRVRFEVNLQRASAADIRLDASLLELASLVRK